MRMFSGLRSLLEGYNGFAYLYTIFLECRYSKISTTIPAYSLALSMEKDRTERRRVNRSPPWTYSITTYRYRSSCATPSQPIYLGDVM